MLDTVRALIALNLDVSAIRRVAAAQRNLRTNPAAPSARIAWVTAANMHVALRVLGDMDQAAAPALLDGLRSLVEPWPAMRLILGTIEPYPNAQHARLLVVPVEEPAGALIQLAERIEALATHFGMPQDRKAFHAHLTLARFREPLEVAAWVGAAGTTSLGEARASDLALYRADLKVAGSEYTAFGRVGFAAPQAPRSQRPSRAPRQSQRPRPKSKPPRADDAAVAATAIPGPPRLPSVAPQPSPGVPRQEPLSETALAPGSAIPPPHSGRVAPLPAEVEAALPDEEDWDR